MVDGSVVNMLCHSLLVWRRFGRSSRQWSLQLAGDAVGIRDTVDAHVWVVCVVLDADPLSLSIHYVAPEISLAFNDTKG